MRVPKPTVHDWKQINKMTKYLQATGDDTHKINANQPINVSTRYSDTAFAVHKDLRITTKALFIHIKEDRSQIPGAA